MFHATLPVPGQKPCGVDVFVHRLAQTLAARDNRVRVYSYSEAPADASYEHARLEWPGQPTKLGRIFMTPLYLNAINTGGLDVLHLHGDDWFYVRRTVPTVRTFHGSALYEARYATSKRRRMSQALIFGLEMMAARLATSSYTVGTGRRRMYKLQGKLDCGVDMGGASLPAKSVHPSILFIGTWQGRKRGRWLYDVFRQHVRSVVGDAELWMVSDDGVHADGVRLWRAPSDARVRELYERAWVFCLPSRYEGLGIPYLEAMACGTPVIATPNPGSRYLLESGRAGMIARDAELGAKLVKVLTCASLREEFAAAGQRRAAAFSWDTIATAHEAAYESAMNSWRLSVRS